MKWMSLLFLLLPVISLAQQRYQIKDETTEESIPFVKVIPAAGNPLLADLDGVFTVPQGVEKCTLRYQGYFDTTIVFPVDSVIFMRPRVQRLGEIEVQPGVNPAHRIMRQAIQNRKANHPKKKDAFRYKSYSKFVADIDPDFVAGIPEDTEDTNLVKVLNFTDSMHLFLMESVSERYFEPPFRDQERIIAYKISGLSDPRFSTFANAFQSFSFYDNQFEVFGKQYINPLALGGLNRYLFSLQDTIVNASDTTYMIYFRPKKGKYFDGIEGNLYINTNGFAVEKVTAHPYQDTSGISVSIVQEYAFLDNSRWFPVKLSTEVDLGDLGVITAGDSSASIVGTGYTYVEDVVFNAPPPKWNDGSVALYTDPDANELDDGTWDTIRKFAITEKEVETYRVVDSLAEAVDVNRFVKILDVLIDGKIPLGNFNFDLSRLIDYNLYEKYRLGAGLETSEKLMKPVMIGGYFAYGTGDKQWKFGGYSHIHLLRRKQMRFELRYQQDVAERGGHQFQISKSPLLGTDVYRDFFITSMERQRLAEVAFRTDLRANLTLRIAQNYQRLEFTKGYQYLSDTNWVNGLDAAVSSLEIQWNPFEKYTVFGYRKVPMKRKYPQLNLLVEKGWNSIGESELDFWRFNASIRQTISWLGLFTFDWKITASKTIGNVPLMFTSVGNGTGRFWNLAVPGTFETMPPATFYSTEQLGAFLRLKFKAFHTNVKWNEPRISLHHAWGIGTFRGANLHQASFNTLDKGYAEAGLILDGILTNKFTAIGLGGFYNYSSYGNEDWRKNIVPKITFSFNLE